MNKTNIEWVKNPDGSQGYTFNPITGCLNGCEYCYARKLANTRLRERYLANLNIAPVSYPLPDIPASLQPFYPRFWSDKCNRTGMVAGKSPKGIFVCDMSDLFGIGIPEDWTHRVLDRCRDMCLHHFYLLTKQPQNLIKFSPFPENCWVGVTATNANMLFDAINHLDDIQCSKRFVSIEPMLASCYLEDLPAHLAGTLDWVIIGVMTCGGADLAKLSYQHPELNPIPYGNRYTLQPKIEWVQEIVEACNKAGTPVFLKDNLWDLLYTSAFDDDIFWANEKATLRQEIPQNG